MVYSLRNINFWAIFFHVLFLLFLVSGKNGQFVQKIGFKNFQNISAQNKATKQNSEQLKNKIVHRAGATLCSVGAAVPIVAACDFFTNFFLNKMLSVSKSLNKGEKKLLSECESKVLEIAKLSNLIKIQNITADTNISDFFQSTNLTPEELLNVKNGINAFFDGSSTVYINNNVNPNLLFHELGHAHNRRFSKLSNKLVPYYHKCLQKVPLAIAFASLILSEEKPKEGKELTKFQKAKNIFRKTLPFIAAASSFPCLFEEGTASLKGNKWAQSILSTDLAKKVAKGNAFAFLTYLATPAAAFLISFLGAKYKDFLQNNKNAQPKKVQAYNNAQNVRQQA